MFFTTNVKLFVIQNLAGIYLLKVDNRITRTRCEIYSKLTIKTLERHHWRVSIVNFEHVIAGWDSYTHTKQNFSCFNSFEKLNDWHF